MRRLLHILGLAVTLLALAFVVREALRSNVIAEIDWRPAALLREFGLAVLAYSVAGLGLAAAWAGLLAAGAGTAVRPIEAMGTYALTQINKYLPSNVMHLAGRHVMMRRAGIGHTPLVLAAGAEIVLLLSVALTIALIGSRGLVAQILAPAWWLLPVFAIVALAATVLLAKPRLHALLAEISPIRLLAASLAAAGTYLLFFLVSAWIARHLLVEVAPDASSIGLVSAATLVSLAWAAGFVVPGSAAGFGVRESILILTFGPLAGDQAATVMAAGYRIVTLAGDLLLFAFGAVWWALRGRREAAARG